MNQELWKRKLMAFLHDPPGKALDIQGHHRVAADCLNRAGIDEQEFDRFTRTCDHTAAAADRFPFPDARHLAVKFSGKAVDGTAFRHPLGGSQLELDPPIPSAKFAEERYQVSQPGFEAEQLGQAERWWARFFLHWRRWPDQSARDAEHPWRFLFLPADTRLPDHSIWNHNSVVSAMQGCVDESGKLRPAFLLLQLGPVQEFIAQARSTRDLWSGSYLLSWLMAHAIRAVTDQVGPDAVIFPSLRGQPIFDLLHRERLYGRISYPGAGGRDETLWERMGLDRRHAELLTPNLPNRFLALVPEGRGEEIAKAAEQAIREELKKIAAASWRWLGSKGLPLRDEWRIRFDGQVEAFPKITWQVFGWGGKSVEEVLKAFETIDEVAAERLRKIKSLAIDTIPTDHRDSRVFQGDQLKNHGFCWPAYYSATDWLLAARRRTRDFPFWAEGENRSQSDGSGSGTVLSPSRSALEGALKDSLSGVEESVGDEDWWINARESSENLFRQADRFGAVNLIKRTWHQAYLAQAPWSLKVKDVVRFESVSGVAAGLWRDRLMAAAESRPEVWHALVEVQERVASCRNQAERLGLSVASEGARERTWIRGTDPACFRRSEWEQSEDESEVRPVVAALENFFKLEFVPAPPSYYAVLALDGDEMGKWVSGEKTPLLKEQLAGKAADYFRGLDLKGAEFEQLRRPLSPSYHLQFSEALSNFGLYLAEPVIEAFGGQLIYSGGDDVLAMLPAESALDCAEALRLAFRGDPNLAKVEALKGLFEVLGSEGGFVRLLRPVPGAPTWPLIVPGPSAEVSAGVAFGHIGSPLQGLVQAAQEAERRAKGKPEKGGFGRGACAVSLFKRSGEILEWGFRWGSGALPLYREFVRLSEGKSPTLSSRFGYALRELLQPYAPPGREGGGGPQDVDGFSARDVIRLELNRVMNRQGNWEDKGTEDPFRKLCNDYLDSLGEAGRPLLRDFPALFDVANFIRRGERS